MKPDKIPAAQDKIPGLPFIKWAGGKRALLADIRSKYPKELGKSITKYCEPFVGGGAVLFDVLSTFKLSEVYISDLNMELIDTYTCIRDNVNVLIETLDGLFTEYIECQTKQTKGAYYIAKREEFNQLIGLTLSGDLKIKRAALFIFLNKTCFNGLYRVNSHGLFNVSLGFIKKIYLNNIKDNILIVSELLQNVKITTAPYTESLSFIDEKTFVYLDPPYRPISTSSCFTAYTTAGFNDQDQIDVAKFVATIDKKGTKFILSNSDPKSVNASDCFFDDLYKKYSISRVSVIRHMGPIKNLPLYKAGEILVSN